jgi:hypothetical protein
MTQAQILQRQKAVAAAIGSVRAEGLKPSAETQERLKDYANGKITVSELRRATLEEVKTASTK